MLTNPFKRVRPERPPSDLPPNMEEDEFRRYVHAAYLLLSDANRRGIQVPSAITEIIVTFRKSDKANFTAQDETKFWNAYGLLSSSIQPAERSRVFHRNVFYGVLVLLLLFQFFFMAGDYVRTKMADLDKQIVDVRGKSAAANPNTTAVISDQAAEIQIKQLNATQQAYIGLTKNIISLVGTILDIPLIPFGFHSFFSISETSVNYPDAGITDNVVIRSKLDMLLVFLSGYLLPLLYGFLGACAFVLRKLSDESDKLTYANDARVRYSLRLNIGLLSGLAVGWFIKPGAGDASLVSLSPLALAFIAGYGSDLFFAALDKIVQAFVPSTPPRQAPDFGGGLGSLGRSAPPPVPRAAVANDPAPVPPSPGAGEPPPASVLPSAAPPAHA